MSYQQIGICGGKIQINQGRIIVITGAPGTGKTTTASAVAKESDLEKSVHMHTDDFYHYLSKGAIPPHLPESNEQNLIVIEAFLEAAKRYARGGYDVIVDGIIGPWFLKPWQSLVREHYEVHYIILRASKEETLKRAVERSKLDRKTNIELVETMWEQFCNLGIYESNVIDTTTYSIQETVSAVQEKIASRAALLSQIVLVQFQFDELNCNKIKSFKAADYGKRFDLIPRGSDLLIYFYELSLRVIKENGFYNSQERYCEQ